MFVVSVLSDSTLLPGLDYNCVTDDTGTVCYGIGATDAAIRQLQALINRFSGVTHVAAVGVDGKLGTLTLNALQAASAYILQTDPAAADLFNQTATFSVVDAVAQVNTLLAAMAPYAPAASAASSSSSSSSSSWSPANWFKSSPATPGALPTTSKWKWIAVGGAITAIGVSIWLAKRHEKRAALGEAAEAWPVVQDMFALMDIDGGERLIADQIPITERWIARCVGERAPSKFQTKRVIYKLYHPIFDRAGEQVDSDRVAVIRTGGNQTMLVSTDSWGKILNYDALPPGVVPGHIDPDDMLRRAGYEMVASCPRAVRKPRKPRR